MGFDPGPVRRRSGTDIRDQRTHHQAIGGGRGLIELLISDPEVGPVHVPRLDQLVRDIVGRVPVEREAQPGAGLRLLDRKVDADDLPRGIQQRTAAVARVDLGIRLDGIQDAFRATG